MPGKMTRGCSRRFAIDAGGFTLLEVIIAAMLIIIIFFGLAQVYTRGRMQLDLEESRRKATALVQARLEGIRRDFTFDTLGTLHEVETTMAVDNRSYKVRHAVTAHAGGEQAATVTVTVAWLAPVGGGVSRSVSGTTVLARSLP